MALIDGIFVMKTKFFNIGKKIIVKESKSNSNKKMQSPKLFKRYKAEHWRGFNFESFCLTELSKTGINNGVQVVFFDDGRKNWQARCKNNLLDGVSKAWCWGIPKNETFKNNKKNKQQGIQIIFQIIKCKI